MGYAERMRAAETAATIGSVEVRVLRLPNIASPNGPSFALDLRVKGGLGPDDVLGVLRRAAAHVQERLLKERSRIIKPDDPGSGMALLHKGEKVIP